MKVTMRVIRNEISAPKVFGVPESTRIARHAVTEWGGVLVTAQAVDDYNLQVSDLTPIDKSVRESVKLPVGQTTGYVLLGGVDEITRQRYGVPVTVPIRSHYSRKNSFVSVSGAQHVATARQQREFAVTAMGQVYEAMYELRRTVVGDDHSMSDGYANWVATDTLQLISPDVLTETDAFNKLREYKHETQSNRR